MSETLAVTGYDPSLRFFATRYKQGDRTVYSLDLSLAQVASLIPAPDPNIVQPGNRRINLPHAASFAQYIRNRPDWAAPGIMLRSHNMFDFESHESIEGTDFGVIAFPRLGMTDLHILDGQHRILGFHMAIMQAAADVDKQRTTLSLARRQEEPDGAIELIRSRMAEIEAQRERFETERISVLVYVVDEQEQFNQMFYDIAENALGIKGSTKVLFDSTNVLNRAVRQVLLHPLLDGHVDTDKDILGRSNENLLTAKHVGDIVRILTVGLDGRMTRRLQSELDQHEVAQNANEFFDLMAASFPQLVQVVDGEMTATDLRQSSQLGSPVTFRALAGLYHDMRENRKTDTQIHRYFKRLNGYLSMPATEAWVSMIGGNGDLIQEGSLGPSSRRQDLKAFKNRLVELSDGRKLPVAPEIRAA